MLSDLWGKADRTDKKWILFILNQLILNSVKYRIESPVFRIYTKKLTSGVALVFQDNGTGIPDEEMGRIFDKGFTGTNGREHQRSTGMGLYLCKKTLYEAGNPHLCRIRVRTGHNNLS